MCVCRKIKEAGGRWVEGEVVRNEERVIYVKEGYEEKFLRICRDSMLYQVKVLIDMCCIDYPNRREKRYTLVYMMCSVHYNKRYRIKTRARGGVGSVSKLFASGGWYEREVWDMFGVAFLGHSDLRRLLTDYGFQGHPMRKDFGLSGYSEVRYDDSEKRVIEEPLELTQEFRNFKYE